MDSYVFSNMFWRIIDEAGYGPDIVTLVLANKAESMALQLETDIVTANFLAEHNKKAIDKEWDKRDTQLLSQLLIHSTEVDKKIHNSILDINIQDEETLEMIFVTAAARFGYLFSRLDLVHDRKQTLMVEAYEVGDQAAVLTDEGFKRVVVVKKNEKTAQVVLMERKYDFSHSPVTLHDLVEVEIADVLPESYCDNSVVPGKLQ